jgi:acyl dehydratase
VTDFAFETDAVGRWTAPLATTIERGEIQAYAEATDDDAAAHRRGDLAPAVFAAVPTTPVLVEAVRRLTREKELPRTTVHAGHDVRIMRPLLPGARVVSRARVVGVEPKESGTVLIVQSETRAGSEVLNEQLATLFVGGIVARRRAGDRASPQTPSGGLDHDPAVRVTMPIDAGQPRRYSAASGDMNPAHLDESAARQAGFPGVIVHGLCTMAFCARAVVAFCCADDPARLRRIAVRFAAPVFPGDSLTTSLWPVRGDGIAFEASSAGSVVVTDGRAQLREHP